MGHFPVRKLLVYQRVPANHQGEKQWSSFFSWMPQDAHEFFNSLLRLLEDRWVEPYRNRKSSVDGRFSPNYLSNLRNHQLNG